jgi:transposase
MIYNKSLKDDEVKLRLLSLVDEGLSVTAASHIAGVPRKTAADFLNRQTHAGFWENYKPHMTMQAAPKYLAEEDYNNFINALKNHETTKPLEDNKPVLHKKDNGEDNSRILIISDMHIPYHHPDTLEFLQHLKDKYKPTRVICLGDELDKHSLSFHDSDPDLPSAGDELRIALPVIAKLKAMFPVMDILESNHGSLLYRKAHVSGIPKQYLKTYNEVLGVDLNWKWWYDMTVELPDGNNCYFHHGKSANVTRTSQTMSMCAVQGHFHETFKIEYWGNPNGLYWAMQAGCLIDDDALAFNYNNCNLKRPIIGTGLIINSQPVLEPMVLNKSGRWIGA